MVGQCRHQTQLVLLHRWFLLLYCTSRQSVISDSSYSKCNNTVAVETVDFHFLQIGRLLIIRQSSDILCGRLLISVSVIIPLLVTVVCYKYNYLSGKRTVLMYFINVPTHKSKSLVASIHPLVVKD
jgi:hypothetical protein